MTGQGPTVIRRRCTRATVTRKSLQIVLCEHCGHPLLHQADGVTKMLVPSRMMAFKSVDGGPVMAGEMNCPACGLSTCLPQLRLVLNDESDGDA